jgi:hypothetical protein
MSKQEITDTDTEQTVCDNERPARRSIDLTRLLPVVAFGVQAAILAGVVISSDPAAAGLSGAIGSLIGVNDTTCCP